MRGRTIAFYAAMFGLTVVAVVVLAGIFFVYQGAMLPRVPVRVTGDWFMERNDWMGFVPTRNGSTEVRYVDNDYRYHIHTDRRSARVNAAGEQSEATVDVLAVGCSFTWGAGIESQDTYIQQLGRILDVSVANLAMASYGSVQAFQMLVRNADLRPKVIVYGFINDHLRRNLSPCAPNNVPHCIPVAYLQREGDQLVLQPPHMELFAPEENRAFNFEVAMREPTDVGALLLGAKWAAKIAYMQYFGPDTVIVDQSPEIAAIALKVMIHAMADEAQKVGARFVVLNIPALVRGRVHPPPDALMNAIAGVDLTFVDFSPVAAAYYRDNATGTLVQGDDPHPNVLANRMIAETLADAVRPLLGPPPSH
jgi:hypothetical protein